MVDLIFLEIKVCAKMANRLIGLQVHFTFFICAIILILQGAILTCYHVPKQWSR